MQGLVSIGGDAERLAGLMSHVGELIRIGRTDVAIRSADRIWDELTLVLEELDREPGRVGGSLARRGRHPFSVAR